MITAIFDAITTIVNAFVALLVNLFTQVVSVFYTPGANGATGELTLVGTLMLISLSTGLVMWGIYFIRSLIRVRRG
jgi:hypothetical protein